MSFPRAPICRVADFNPVGPKGSTLGTNQVAFVPMAAVSEDGSMRVAEHKAGSDLSNGYSYFQSGDVLVAKITPCFENNKIAVANIDRDHGFGSTEFHVLRPHDELDARYLAYFLRQDSIRELGQKRMTGSAGQRRVPRQFLEQLEIPLPPLDEQRRIAAILDHADALRHKRREAVAQLGTLRAALLAELLSSLGSEIRFLSLAECISEFRYGTSEKATGTGLPVLRIPNVIGSTIALEDLKYVPLSEKETARLRLQSGDLIFVRTNGNRDYVGRSAVVTSNLGKEMGLTPGDFVYASYLIRGRPETSKVSPVFLQSYLSSADGRRSMLERAKTSAGQFNINVESLSSLPVPVPDLRMQREFATKVITIDIEVQRSRVHERHLGTLFSSLQHRAFRGEL